MARLMELDQAVSELIHAGDTVAMEGFTHLIPHAAAQETIRQGIGDLVLARLTPDLLSDQLIGAGCVAKLIFSWGGNPGVGSLHRFRDAIENGWPRPMEIEEHSHAGLTNRYVAGASGLPFAILRGYAGTSLQGKTANIKSVECPFTGEQLAAVPALNPDVAVVHAQQADSAGNVHIWGITGVQKEAILSSRRSLVTVEEIVDHIDLKPGGIVIPSWVVTAFVHAPGGAHPSYAAGYSERDNQYYSDWEAISRSREGFKQWLDEVIYKGERR